MKDKKKPRKMSMQQALQRLGVAEQVYALTGRGLDVTMSLRLQAEDKTTLDQMAAAQGKNVSVLIRDILERETKIFRHEGEGI